MAILFNLAIVVLIFWSVFKIFAPLIPGENGMDAEYAGQLVGWCIGITFFYFLFFG